MISHKEQSMVLDTNFLIKFNEWLPQKLYPDFWQQLEDSLIAGKWLLLDVVVKEVHGKKSPLCRWLKRQSDNNRVSIVSDEEKIRGMVINNSYQVMDDVSRKSETDLYIISYAEKNKLAVVTYERKKNPDELLNKIPDVCDKMRIKCFRRPLQFYERIGLSKVADG